MNNIPFNKRNGRIVGGLFLLGIGVVLLLQQMHVFFPFWLFSWPVILIAVGIFLGLSQGFRGPAWLILIFIGCIFLFDRIVPEYALRRYLWPVAIIIIGAVLILKPRRSGGDHWRSPGFDDQQRHSQGNPMHAEPTQHYAANESSFDASDYLDSTSIFGGIRKVILSKNFKGGEAVSVFGGNEIDLSKADISGTVQLELTQICGGTKLIVPNHWNIRSEMVALLGGIEDKRQVDSSKVDQSKTLVLRGTSILGGIEIRNY